MPNDWLPNHVPVCGCPSDHSSRANCCWFAFPGLDLWRKIESFGIHPGGKLNRNVLPLDRRCPGVTIKETGTDGEFATFPMQFSAGLKAGKPTRKNSTCRGPSAESQMTITFPGPSGMVEAVFRTRFETPTGDGQ